MTAGDLQQLKNKDPQNEIENKPKAYLNYVFPACRSLGAGRFDNQLKFVNDGSGVKQVEGDPGQLETLSSGKVVAKKNGYVYVYTSNESQQDVLFDNLGVLDITGPVLEETHYYPFGLTMAGISTTAPLKLEGKRKFNGIEFNHKEFSDGSGLDLYTANFRGLDPQIGRWWQLDPRVEVIKFESPYIAMGNNPINKTDPQGDLFFGLFGSTGKERRAARDFAKNNEGEIHDFLGKNIHVSYSYGTQTLNYRTFKWQFTEVSTNQYFYRDGSYVHANGDIKPYRPNFWGRNFEEENGVFAKNPFAKILYGTLNDAYITYSGLRYGRLNDRTLSLHGVNQSEFLNSSMNTIINAIPFDKVGETIGIGDKVLNVAEFNKLFKGTGMTASKYSGQLIREYNYIIKQSKDLKIAVPAFMEAASSLSLFPTNNESNN